MELNWLLLCCGAFIGCFILPPATSDSVIVVSKRYTNNSYTCFAHHTKDGLEYQLTYNVCFSTANETAGIQCLYYECTIASRELIDTDGKLRCLRYGYSPPSLHQPLFDRLASFHREWPSERRRTLPATQRTRRKRDFSWVSFLEKFSFMGRHQSTVSKQNEAYLHYNFMNNKPSTGGGPTPVDGGGGVRPIAVVPSEIPAPPPIVAALPAEQP